VVSPYEIDEIFPDAVAGLVRPLHRVSNTAQGLTTTLVADYTVHSRAWLPSAAIVALVGELGVSSGGARPPSAGFPAGGSWTAAVRDGTAPTG